MSDRHLAFPDVDAVVLAEVAEACRRPDDAQRIRLARSLAVSVPTVPAETLDELAADTGGIVAALVLEVRARDGFQLTVAQLTMTGRSGSRAVRQAVYAGAPGAAAALAPLAAEAPAGALGRRDFTL